MSRGPDPGEGTVAGVAVDDLGRWVGQLGQVARIDSLVEDQGSARGSRRLRMVTGGGLEAEIHPDRALDIGQVTYRGLPIAWISPVGIGGPDGYDPGGPGWLRTFGGGLLTTCGLDTFGPPSEHDGVGYGLHGRIGTQRARLLRSEVTDGQLVVVAEIRQAAVHGECLVLRRTISAPIGSSSIRVSDTVRNDGWAPAGHMLLYHCNVGWPLLDQTATLSIPSRTVTGRGDETAADIAAWDRIGPPTAGFREQLIRHDGLGPAPVVRLDNPAVDLRLELRFGGDTLPTLHQWKMTGEGHYVLGLEPANVNWTGGRASAAAAGVLPILPPRSSTHYWLEFSLSPSATEAGSPTRSGAR